MIDAITFEQWEDSQRNELYYWSRQYAAGNPEQIQRNAYYLSNMEGKCDMIQRFMSTHMHAHAAILDLGSGPRGICHVIDALIRVAVDPLMDEYRKIGYRVDSNGVLNLTIPAEYLGNYLQNCIDLLFCLNSIDHHRDPAQSLQSIYKVLRPGGHAFILTDLRPVKLLDVYHKLPLTREQLINWSIWCKFTVVAEQTFPHGAGNSIPQFIMHLVKA